MALNRRDFLKNGTAGLAVTGASFLFPMELLAAMRKKVGPNDTINIGLIGCKGMGFSDLTSMLKMGDTNVIALCDVDETVLQSRTLVYGLSSSFGKQRYRRSSHRYTGSLALSSVN